MSAGLARNCVCGPGWGRIANCPDCHLIAPVLRDVDSDLGLDRAAARTRQPRLHRGVHADDFAPAFDAALDTSQIARIAGLLDLADRRLDFFAVAAGALLAR